MPNFVSIGQSIADIWRFSDFSRWRLPPSWILIFFTRSRTVSLCQISSKSLEPRPRYGDFSITQDGGRRYLGILNLEIFNGWTREKCRTASPCQITRRSVKPLRRYRAFWIFQDDGCPPSWICDACVGTTNVGHLIVCDCLLIHCAKCGWNRCSSFDNNLCTF